MSTVKDPRAALARVLTLNAGSSLLIGIAMLTASAPLAGWMLADGVPPDGRALMGLTGADLVWLTGLGLMPFALAVALVARDPGARPGLVTVIIALDWSWVLASLLLLGLAWNAFSWPGIIVVDAMAVAVAGFAVLQARYLGAMRQGVEAPAI